MRASVRLVPKYPGTPGIRSIGDDREHYYLILAEDGREVGDVKMWMNDGDPYVSGIGLEPHERGKGYGRAAVAAILDERPSARGLSGMSLRDAEGFWEALGCTWPSSGNGDYREFELDRWALLLG